MTKKLYRVKFEYAEHFFKEDTLKIPCFGPEYGAFFFNWSIETAKQFIKHIMSLQPTKFYLSSTCEVEAISSKVELFQKIMVYFSENSKDYFLN